MPTILCHPDNFQLVQRACGVSYGDKPFGGVRIITNKHLPKFRSEYKPPRSRFIEYEKSDEPWLKYFGFGGVVETLEPLFLQVRDDEWFRPPATFMETAWDRPWIPT